MHTQKETETNMNNTLQTLSKEYNSPPKILPSITSVLTVKREGAPVF
jgi:hypothetical protein